MNKSGGVKDIIETLKESEEKLEMFFSQSLDGFFFMMLDEPVVWNDDIDKDATLEYVFAHQRVTKINDAMLKQYGAERDQFLNLTPNDFFAHDIAYGKSVWKEFFNHGHLHVETAERKFDGSQMFVEGDYICMYDQDKRITGHFGIQRDVTERKLTEARLTQLNEELRQSDIEKNKLFSIIAHDLRSPLHGLLGLTEVLSTDAESLDKAEIVRFSRELHITAMSIYKLIENLLDWSLVQKGKLTFQPVRTGLYPIVLQCISEVNQKAIQKEITIKNNVIRTQMIFADEKMISSVIRNLITNAIKFTNRGGTVVITSEATDKAVTISVQDNGIGMPESLRARLFRIGEKVRRTGTDKEPSSGLGLLLCKEFINKHNGTLSVASEEGKGSTFTITLPVGQ